MCVNINNVTVEDIQKLKDLVKDLNGETELTDSPSALGALLGLFAVMLAAGENLHLVGPDVLEELKRRAQINMERADQNLPPKMDDDWMKEDIAEKMGVSVEEVDAQIQQAVQQAQQNGGVVPPGAYEPPAGRPTINPVGEEPTAEGGYGMYL